MTSIDFVLHMGGVNDPLDALPASRDNQPQ